MEAAPNFLTMHSTMDLDLYLRTLEHAAAELPSILHEWGTLDDDLCREYSDQLREILSAHMEMSRRASDERRGPAFAIRIAFATAKIRAMARDVACAMGFSVDQVLRTQTAGVELPNPPPIAGTALAA